MTTQTEIGEWFDEGVAKGSAYMLILCDTYDWDDYPVYTSNGDEATRRAKHPGEMQKLMEVYDLHMSRDEQLRKHRVMNLPAAQGTSAPG